MKSVLLTLMASTAMLAAQAVADPAGGPRATLYDRPELQGDSITITGGSSNLDAQQFAGRAMSGHSDGEWTVCEGPDFGGRCQVVSGDIHDMSDVGLAQRVISLHAGEPDAQEALAAPPPAPSGPPQAAASEAQPSAQMDQGPSDQAQAEVQPSELGQAEADMAVGVRHRSDAGQDDEARNEMQPADQNQTAAANTDFSRGAAGHQVIFFARPMRAGSDVDGQGSADAFCRDQGLGPALYYDTDDGALRDLVCRRD